MRILVAVALLACTLPARAQQPPAADVRPATLRSEILGQERRLLVRLPPGYERSGRRYPVLYVTDGSRQVPLLSQTVAFLAASGRMPEVIVVGIDPVERTNELTPTKGAIVGEERLEFPTSGGADRFLAFVEKELVPWVERTYRTEPFRILAGHSFGGLFVLHALQTRPGLFQALVAVAPTLGWNGDEPVRRTRELLARRRDLAGVLVIAAADEGPVAARRLEELGAALEGTGPGLRTKVLRFPGEDHMSVLLDGNYHALREVFAGWRMDVPPGGVGPRGGLAAVEAHYARLSAGLGWAITPPEELVNLAGYQALRDRDLDEAIRTFQRNVAWYPASANVHDSLGEALEAAGRLDDAAREYRAAWDAGERAADPNAAAYRAHLERVQAAVQRARAPRP